MHTGTIGQKRYLIITGNYLNFPNEYSEAATPQFFSSLFFCFFLQPQQKQQVNIYIFRQIIIFQTTNDNLFLIWLPGNGAVKVCLQRKQLFPNASFPNL